MKPLQTGAGHDLLTYGVANFSTRNEQLHRKDLIQLMKNLPIKEEDTHKTFTFKDPSNKAFEVTIGLFFKPASGQNAARLTFNYNPILFEKMVKKNKLDREDTELVAFFRLAHFLDIVYNKLHAEAITVARSVDHVVNDLSFENLLMKHITHKATMSHVSISIYNEPVQENSFVLTEEHVDNSLFTVHGFDSASQINIKTTLGKFIRVSQKNKALVYLGELGQNILNKYIEATNEKRDKLNQSHIKYKPLLTAVQHSCNKETQTPCVSLQFYAMCRT